MAEPASWLRTVEPDDADAATRSALDAARGPRGQLDNLYRPFAWRGHMLGPADGLYRAIWHDARTTLPARVLELIAAQVAALTGCDYGLAHHGANFLALSADRDRAVRILADLPAAGCDDEIAPVLAYVEKLTLSPAAMVAADLDRLRDHGLDDGQIFEINQAAAAMAYWARVATGLGIRLGDEAIGFYDADQTIGNRG